MADLDLIHETIETTVQVFRNGQELNTHNRKRKRKSESLAPAQTPPSLDPHDGCRLYIGNLAYGASGKVLQEFFSGYHLGPEAFTIPVNPRKNRPVGFAFVNMQTPQQATDAISSLSGQEVLGRTVSVQMARETAPSKDANDSHAEKRHETEYEHSTVVNPRIGNDERQQFVTKNESEEEETIKMPPIKQEQDDEVHWSTRACTTPEGSPVPQLPQSVMLAELWVYAQNVPDHARDSMTTNLRLLLMDLGVSEAQLQNAEMIWRLQDHEPSTTDTVAVNGDQEDRGAVPGTAKEIRQPKQRGRGPLEAGIPSTTKVMVANLPHDFSDEKLTELFTAYELSSVKMALRPVPRFIIKKLKARGQPRKSRGYGFVTLASEKMQQKAIIEMDGKEVEGRPIAVKVAVNRPGNPDDHPLPAY